MRTEPVTFYSHGSKVCAFWYTPDQASAPLPAIVQGPGWMGLADAAVYDAYHEAFTAAGFAVLSTNYRGFGGSEGDPSIAGQVADLRNAVTYLQMRSDVLPDAIGAFATGGTGGGNIVALGATDDRIRAVISQFPVADGGRWLRGMRADHEWFTLLARVQANEADIVCGKPGELVAPTTIMVPEPNRAERGFKADVAKRIPQTIPLHIVRELLDYRPSQLAQGMQTPLMVVAAQQDATTPIEHAQEIFDAAGGPRVLVNLRDVGHYEAYERYGKETMELMVDFFAKHVRSPGGITTMEMGGQ